MQAEKARLGCGIYSRISTLQVIFGLKKQENVLIRVLICGPKNPVWVAGSVPALVTLGLCSKWGLCSK